MTWNLLWVSLAVVGHRRKGTSATAVIEVEYRSIVLDPKVDLAVFERPQ